MNPLPINLSSLLHGRSVEWERLEFKRGWNPVDVLHTVCAFANDFHNLGGGYIVIGLEEQDGKPVFPPVGVKQEMIDAIQKEMLHLGHTAIQPAYHPILTPYEWDGKTLLVIWGPGGQVRPYKAKISLGRCQTGGKVGARVERQEARVTARVKEQETRVRARVAGTFTSGAFIECY